MNKTISSILAAAALTLAVSCSEPADNASPILQVLGEAVENGAFLFGHQDDLCYGHDWDVTDPSGDDCTRSDVFSTCGHYPYIAGFDLNNLELGLKENIDHVTFEHMRRSAIAHYERGGIVTFSWHLNNPLTGGNAWDNSSDEVVASILEGGECHEKFVGWMSAIADFLLSLRDSEGNQIVTIFRPWHEHTGSWFWWGKDHCTPEQFNALWRMTYNYIAVERGVKAIWALSPSGTEIDSWTERYPGPEYVDIIGVDHYLKIRPGEALEDARVRYIGEIQHHLGALQGIVERDGKLLAVTETGCESVPYDEWWTDVLFPAIEGFPVSYVLTWRNSQFDARHYFVPFPGQQSEKDFLKFFESDRTVFLGD